MRDSINRVFKVLDTIVEKFKTINIAYSGGKDSTCVALLVYDWIVERKINDIVVVLVNSDTLSEVPEMRDWTIEFMDKYCEKLHEVGVRTLYYVVKPAFHESFYWRTIIRGYPAPTFKFRWCVHLLKRKPAKEILNKTSMLILGHRDEESIARASALKKRAGVCPLMPGGCISYYLFEEGRSTNIYPIRDWSERDVWSYLKNMNSKRIIDLNKLFRLYGYGLLKARYGCWHCTLVKQQFAHYILDEKYLYLEATRLIYRWVSDIPGLRTNKNSGYSSFGHLLPPARSILLYSISIAEKLSGIRIYGLDETGINEYTLRQILYELEPNEVNKLIQRIESNRNYRVYSIEDIRYPREKRTILDALKFMELRAKNEKLELREYLDTLLNELALIIK